MRVNQPARLYKKEELSIADKIDNFIQDHITYFIILFMVMLVIIFVALMYSIVGISATESGAVYNNMTRWI